jgi:hypothetical protein
MPKNTKKIAVKKGIKRTKRKNINKLLKDLQEAMKVAKENSTRYYPIPAMSPLMVPIPTNWPDRPKPRPLEIICGSTTIGNY